MVAVGSLAEELCRQQGFERVRPLGVGGSAEVFVAACPPDGPDATVRHVAIKICREAGGTGAAHEQFANECRALIRLRGAQHVVRYIDSGTLSGHPFLITEHCAGSLAAVLHEQGGRVPLQRALQYGIDLAKGLLAAHAAGIVHGDVTPQNALVRADGTVVLADFGMAVEAGSAGLPSPGFDPAHAAPESVAGAAADRRTDVYGLGSTLYTLITGSPPGRRDRRKALSAALRSAGASGDAVTQLIATVTAMLADDPAGRPDPITVVDVLIAARLARVQRPHGIVSDRTMVRYAKLGAAVLLVGALGAGAALVAVNVSGRPAPAAAAAGDARCIADGTPITMRNHHTRQLLATLGAEIGVAAGTPSSSEQLIARQAQDTGTGRCGIRIAVTDSGAPDARCLEASAGETSDVVAAPCRDVDQQVWLVENHRYAEDVMWQRLHPLLDDARCVQLESDDQRPGRSVARAVSCGTDWRQQWDVGTGPTVADGDPGAAGDERQNCSPPFPVPLVDATGSPTGAPDLTVRACTVSEGGVDHARIVGSSGQELRSVLVSWRIELRSCRSAVGLTARDYAPAQLHQNVSTFTSTTAGLPPSPDPDTRVANGRVGWAVVTDSAGKLWHAGRMADPIGTDCAAAAQPAAEVPATGERSGSVTDLEPEGGFDFDFGDQGGPEDRPGLDISGQREQYHFDSLATTEGGRLKQLPPRAAAYGKDDCAAAPGEWTKNVPGVPVGNSICVITSEGNTAILTITKAWTGPGAAERRVGFTYRIWYR